MKATNLLLILALSFSTGCWADTKREENLSRVAALHAAGGQANIEAIDAFTKGLPRDEQHDLEVDVWAMLRRSGAITRTQYIENMLQTNLDFAPDDLAALDYWRYSLMQSKRLDKGLIDEDQYRYLVDSKMDSARRLQARQQELNVVNERAAQNQADIARREAAAQEANYLQIIGGTLQQQNRPAVTTTCTQLGISTTCRSR